MGSGGLMKKDSIPIGISCATGLFEAEKALEVACLQAFSVVAGLRSRACHLCQKCAFDTKTLLVACHLAQSVTAERLGD
jgi:hypothetical protein